jgi:hypothetical protein
MGCEAFWDVRRGFLMEYQELEEKRCLDILVYALKKKELRSDDYEVLSQFGNEEGAKLA